MFFETLHLLMLSFLPSPACRELMLQIRNINQFFFNEHRSSERHWILLASLGA
ncbi:hypothetical protein M758_1G203500 [Ceratodon purpureus]|uniref:Uncharacterized protein n=1 Tax=Ceratodon purpureus TaxID=3225 RepID=A0A8T0JBB7_CERPU|nr:hypothetical protein KC19_1G217400 [Ceratodon purpureus]KAG0630785.1 hypothetical protein M758_1G203500 [Ceratodon purpureus]